MKVVIRDDGVGGGVWDGGVGPILATFGGTEESARLSTVKSAECGDGRSGLRLEVLALLSLL